MGEQESSGSEPADVFVSYRRADRDFVDTLVDHLERRGVAVWWDADIEGGVDWRETIVENLRHSAFVLLVFSEECNSSTELKKELAVASHFKKDVVPVLIEETKPKGAYLYELADRNWITIAPDPHLKVDVLADQLIDRIDRPISPPATSFPSELPASQGPTLPPPSQTAITDASPGTADEVSGGEPPVNTSSDVDARSKMETVRDPDPAAAHWMQQPPSTDSLARADEDHREGTRAGPQHSAGSSTAEIKAVIDADARPDRRDFLPFRWFDFILPILVFALFLFSGEGSTFADNAAYALGFAALALGITGVVAFPIRYYRRRRSPHRVLIMLSLSNLCLAFASGVGFALGTSAVNEGEPESEQFSPGEAFFSFFLFGLFMFVILSVIALLIFWRASKRRADRELQEEMVSL